ncbi:hypothetical protein, partial [Ralstonia pseudosolanacearum]|uniref:hypothetical protein n=1 Tax=Ralstonia pseudosolanacearum TaxID=1310165 RepID=UPI001E4C56EF
ALACSTAWPRSLALSPSASPEFQLTGVAPPSNSIYATTPLLCISHIKTKAARPPITVIHRRNRHESALVPGHGDDYTRQPKNETASGLHARTHRERHGSSASNSIFRISAIRFFEYFLAVAALLHKSNLKAELLL